MLLFLISILASNPRLQAFPGRRIPSLEVPDDPQDRETGRHPHFDSTGLAHLSNDGRLLIGWNLAKTISAYDIREGKTLYYQNVWYRHESNGRDSVANDLQSHADPVGHRKMTGYGPEGRVLGFYGGIYLVATYSGTSAKPIVISAVNPKGRDASANRVLGKLATTPTFNLWSFQDASHGWVALETIQNAPGKPRQRAVIHVTSVDRGPSGAFHLGKRVQFIPPWSDQAVVYPQDFDARTGEMLFRLDEQTYAVANLRTGQKRRLRLPRKEVLRAFNPMLRFAGGAIFCWYLHDFRSPGGELYVSTDQKTWKKIGPYQIVALSFDRKLVLLRSDAAEVWLCSVDKLADRGSRHEPALAVGSE